MATLTTGEPAAIHLGRDTCRTTHLGAVGAVLARGWHLIALAAVTAAGAGLRFFRMDRPTLWGDEAATFSRVNGSYYEMLEYLQYDGFPPIHYQLYWLLGRVTYLDPWMMRLIPATAGALMVLAMYFTARQVVSKQAALVAAVLTVGSAWMLAHSRDAKMYMLTWLMVTMAMGCLFCWLRTDRKLAWLGWIFFGLAAVGTHASAMIMLAFMPVFVLVSPRLFTLRLPQLKDRRAAWLLQLVPAAVLTVAGLVAATAMGVWDLTDGWATWLDALLLGAGGYVVFMLVLCPWLTNWRLHLMGLGFAAIGAGPALYYYFFNKWIARTGGIFSGMTVSASAMDGLLVMAATAIMVMLLFPLVRGPRARWAVVGAALALSVTTGGAFYFNSRGTQQTAADRTALIGHNAAAALAAGELGQDAGDDAAAGGDAEGPAGEFNDGRDEFAGWQASGLTWLRVQSGPETLLRSTSVFMAGWHWPDDRRLNQKVRGGDYVIPRIVKHGALTVLSVAALACGLALLPWSRRIAAKPGEGEPVLAGDAERAAVPGYRGATWVLLWLVLPTYGFYYCRSIEGFVPPWHWLDVAWSKVEAVWLGLLGIEAAAPDAGWPQRLALGWHGVPWWLAVLAAIGLTALLAMRWWLPRLVVQCAVGFTLLLPIKHALSQGGWDWLGLYVAALLEPLPFAILCVGVPALLLHHGGTNWARRGVQSARVLYAVAVVLSFCAVVWLFWFVMREVADNRGMLAWLAGQTASRRAYEWKPLWTPRYLGIVWPAVALAFAWLVMRLPGWPTRAAVLGVFLAFNLGSGVARITLDTEPRLDLMAADIWSANDQPDAFAVYFFNGHGGKSWRNAARLQHWTGSYYLCNHKQIRPSPHEVRGSWIYGGNRRDINQVPKRLDNPPADIHFNQLPQQLGGQPDLERLVIWTHYRAGPRPDTSGNTALEDALGPRWQLVDDQFFSQWRHKQWSRGNWTRRREFVRADGPADEPEREDASDGPVAAGHAHAAQSQGPPG